MASLTVLESFEQQLSVLTAEITADRSKLLLVGTDVEKRALVKQAERHMDEAKELLEQMELEVRQLQPSERQKYQTRLESHRTEMGRLEQDLAKAIRSSNSRGAEESADLREELFGGSEDADQRMRLLDNTERLERCSRRLDAGYRIAIETEQIGTGILENLHSQRETISRARDRALMCDKVSKLIDHYDAFQRSMLKETDEDLGKSSRILTAMMRRLLQNRVILYLVSGFVFVVVIITIYLASS